MSFRFQNTKALLTYKTHLNKENYIKWFTELVKDEPKFIRLAHEFGSHEEEQEKYEHTHVVFKLSKKFESANARIFDYEDIHPHIKLLKNEKAFNDAIQYITKEDDANKDLIVEKEFNHCITEGVWNEPSIHDALLKYVKKPGDVLGILALFNIKKKTIEIDDEDIPELTWQREIMKEFEGRAVGGRRRKVTWIYDKVGNAGKTKLARYLMLTEPNKWFMCKDLGTSRDGATVITNALDSGWTGHGMILDLPRQAENHSRMYSYIEEIKDGVVTAQKYQGSTRVFNIPHLIVFSNWMPMLNKLSRDRWDIRELKKDKKTKDVFMTHRKLTSADFLSSRNGDIDEAESDSEEDSANETPKKS